MKVILIGLGIVACAGSVRPAALPYLTVQGTPAQRPIVVERAIDRSLLVLGVPSLASVALPAGYRELRLSRGHGMVLGAEYPLIRLIERPEGVTGEVIRFRGTRDTAGPDISWTARVVRPMRRPDWSRLAQHLDTLGVESFEVPRYRTAISDAGDLVVEVRRGAEYRAYEVNAPHLRPDTASQRAARIAAVVDSLERLTRGHQ